MDIRKFAADVFSDQFGKVAPAATLVKFSAIPVGDYFLDDGIVYEKLAEATSKFDPGLARGPKRHALGTGCYEFEGDAEVEPA